MRQGFKILDADSHVMEPRDLWIKRIEARFRDRAPRSDFRQEDRAWGQMVVDGIPMYRNYPSGLAEAFQQRITQQYAEFEREGFNPSSQLRAMDCQGIDISFLYPSLALGSAALDGQDPALGWAIVRAYNDWLAEYCSFAPERLRPVALIALHNCEFAVAELHRVVRDHGIKAVMLRPNMIGGRSVGHPDFEPFWAECESLGVSVSFHEGCHTRLPAAGSDRFTTHLAMHACCHPMEQMMAFVALIEGGVLERHPGLRVGFMEAGCGWVPYLLWRLDELEFKHWRFQIPELKRPPSEYFRRQCWVTVEGCEPYLPRVVDEIGADRLLFASDYPHPDHDFGEEVLDLVNARLDSSVKRQIFWENPIRFYGLEER